MLKKFHKKYFLSIRFIWILMTPFMTQATAVSSPVQQFASCLEQSIDILEVRDIKDFYRVRNIPKHCCSCLAEALLDKSLKDAVDDLDLENCRINAFFIDDGVFDPHNHPVPFISYIFHGGYSQRLFSMISDEEVNAQKIPVQHFTINTQTDSLISHGETFLKQNAVQSFAEHNFVIFDRSEIIHDIISFEKDTLSVNFLSRKNNNKIDVFTFSDNTSRKVLLKKDILETPSDHIKKGVVDKIISILNKND